MVGHTRRIKRKKKKKKKKEINPLLRIGQLSLRAPRV
jgi:hypothetical protein